ncbi:MAG: polysaccharide ABC transporter ATP-binding protein [Candidatus Promineifilaceae bacterium]|nr:polysaccharide ABC transporter ATP-binding protein [Candidatus Promineifilaceae bacterium]
MNKVAVEVNGLGKMYHIGRQQANYATIREAAARTVLSPIQKAGQLIRGKATAASGLEEIIWALQDVSFAVQHGEVLGIVGRNGAGKSTLLKILSRITEPTTGYAEINGRIGSLLEVGTGFHPELTGRENIFLNGAILGMRRSEIGRKFDEIVAFAEVEKFIDTPVKHFSSGMYLRLAFAVAAHLEPEILVIDEVLAVGDAAFQKKCLGKMGEVARQGRTVLFVSHNMVAVRNLCNRSLWIHDGQILLAGPTTDVVDAYLQNSLGSEVADDLNLLLEQLPDDPALRLDKIDIRQNGKPVTVVINGQHFEIEIQYTVREVVRGLRIFFDILDEQGTILIRSFNDDDSDEVPIIYPGTYRSTAVIPANLLAPREYELIIRGTIFNVRQCTGDGVRVRLSVGATSGINRAYPQEPIRSKLQPAIPWSNTST